MLGFYWFDPFMWLLCYFLSKDIEIACDQKVLAYIGISEKKRYASSLYQMAETYSENFLLFSGFGKNPAVERIDKIMKYKKRKIILPLSVLLTVMAGLWLVWTFLDGIRQLRYVNETLGEAYEHKFWGKCITWAVGGWVGYYGLAITYVLGLHLLGIGF